MKRYMGDVFLLVIGSNSMLYIKKTHLMKARPTVESISHHHIAKAVHLWKSHFHFKWIFEFDDNVLIVQLPSPDALATHKWVLSPIQLRQ